MHPYSVTLSRAFLLIFSGIWLILSTNCSGKKIKPSYVTSEANYVVALEVKNLFKKSQSLKNAFFPALQPFLGLPLSEKSKQLFTILSAEISSKDYFFIYGEEWNPENREYLALAFRLKNSENLENETLRKHSVDFQTLSDKKLIQQQNVLFCWEKERAMMLLFKPGTSEIRQKEKLAKYWGVKPADYLENTHSEFKTLLQNKFDGAFWINYAKLNPLMQWAEAASLKIPERIKELNQTARNLTFSVECNRNKANIKSHLYFDYSVLQKAWSSVKFSLNEDLLKDIPIARPAIFFHFGLGIEGLKEIVKESFFPDGSEKILSFLGISIDETIDAFSGDFALAIDRLRTTDDGYFLNDLVLMAGLKDRKKLETLLDRISGLPFVKKKKDYYLLRGDDFGDHYLVMKDDKLLLTNDDELRDELLKPTTRLHRSLVKLSEGKLSAYSLDMEKIFQNLDTKKIKDLTFQHIRNSTENVKLIQGNSKIYGTNALQVNMDLQLKKTQEQALEVCMQWLKELLVSRKEKPLPPPAGS